MVRSWNAPGGASQGFLVVPIAFWLSYRALASEPAQTADPAWWWLLPTALVSFTWLFWHAATVTVLEQAAATILIWTAAASVLGWRHGRALLFPVGYVFIAIHVWDALLPVLQPLTAAAAGLLSGLLGIPTYLEGNLVHIPNGTFEIEEGCAGLRYFVSAIAIAALYAHLEYRRWSSWLAIIGFAALLAVVGNWIRVVIVIRAGHVSGMDHPWVRDHADVGWVIFALTLVPLFAFGRRLDTSELAHPGPRPALASVLADNPKRLATAYLATLVAAAWPLAFSVAVAQAASGGIEPPEPMTPPQGLQGWRGPLPADGDWKPASAPADATFLVSYEQEAIRVTFFHAFYANQAQGREVIGYDSRIQGEDWTLTEEDCVTDPSLGEWRRATLTRHDTRRVVLYRYVVGGRPTTSKLEAKLRQGLSPFTRDRSASMVAVSARCGQSCDRATGNGARLLSAWAAAKAADGE
jgi:EpsI family protein